MQLLSTVFAIDLCAYAVMSNHYHVVIRIDVEKAGRWDDSEVAERWLRLFAGPALIHDWQSGAVLSRTQRLIAKQFINCWRQRLTDVSWFMRCLNEPIARQANHEDHCTGRFWEGRFKSQALLDEKALLACMAYVDLNPIRAAMAATPETSDYTSIQARIREPQNHGLLTFTHDLSEQNAIALPFELPDYLEMVDWAGRAMLPDKRGNIESSLPPILERLSLQHNALLKYLGNARDEPLRALGSATQLRAMAKSLGMKFLHGMNWSKQLYAISG